MKRREALKTLGLATAGLVALPAWASGWRVQDVVIESSNFSSTEQELLSSVANTIIPAKNDVGAIPQQVDKFLIRLFDECYEKNERDNIKQQLNFMNDRATEKFGIPYSDCSQDQREQVFLSFDKSADESQQRFFDLVKSETIRGFRTSKTVMEKYYGYKIVPGHYNGNIDIEV